MSARTVFWILCATATLPGLLTFKFASAMQRGGPGPCSQSPGSDCYFVPDDNAVELCDGSVTQICASIATQSACNGAERVDRNSITKKCCPTQDPLRCVSTSTWCWRKWKCKWVVGTGGTGYCSNDSLQDSATAMTATIQACPP